MDIKKAELLIKKYNQPGPRYTSYPTALQFQEFETPDPLLEVQADNKNSLSLYYHLPFCETLCWFCACTTVITRNLNKADPYLEALEKEMDLFKAKRNDFPKVEQLHFGGGSPSFQTPEQLDRICNSIYDRFTFESDAEISAELDPRTLSKEKVDVLAKHGFNRASFGVQDVNSEVQLAIHRIQPDKMNRDCLQWIRDAGIEKVNIDLIYGLPFQTVQSFEQTLKTVLEYDPDRFAIFSYAHVPWIAPAQKILEKKTLPAPEIKFQMLLKAIEILSDAGYEYVGMDHFAKKDDTLITALSNGELHRNFQGYSTKAGRELAAFGMSAISQTETAYRQNAKELEDYYQYIDSNKLPVTKGYIMTSEDILRKQIIMKLMCSGTVEFNQIESKYNIDFEVHFASALKNLHPMEDDGLVQIQNDSISITSDGRLLVRNIAMQFDQYLKSTENRHAKTI